MSARALKLFIGLGVSIPRRVLLDNQGLGIQKSLDLGYSKSVGVDNTRKGILQIRRGVFRCPGIAPARIKLACQCALSGWRVPSFFPGRPGRLGWGYLGGKRAPGCAHTCDTTTLLMDMLFACRAAPAKSSLFQAKTATIAYTAVAPRM